MDFIVFALSASALTLAILIKCYVPSVVYVPAVLFFISITGLLWVTIRKLFTYCIFPGSLWMFRRSLELVYSKEISLQVYKKLDKLKCYLEELKNSSIDICSFIDPSIKKLIDTLAENLDSIEKKSRKQSDLLSHLLKLKKSIELIKVKINYAEMSFWTWIDSNDEDSESIFEFNLTEKNEEGIKNSIVIIEAIQSQMKTSFIDKNCLGRFFSYFSDYNIGTLEYMRCDLLKRFDCDEHVIDGVIDSIIVKAEDDSGSAVLFCNPNAGFYEFIYFQSEWVEFYLARKISLILWNYRGYGASSGKPDVKGIVEDGLRVINYYKGLFDIKSLALHGESIGGYVAIQLASRVKCDFLLADRTFGCLSDVIKYSYGIFAYFIYKITLFPDCDNTSAFLSLTCYKLMVCDPCDKIIPDHVSLKSSVAVNLLMKQRLTINDFFTSSLYKNMNYVLTHSELQKLSKSLLVIINILHLSLDEEFAEKKKLVMKTESQDNTERTLCYKKLLNIFTDFNSCGVPLKSLARHKNSENFLKIWIMTLEIWGGVNGVFENNDNSSIDRFSKELKAVMSEFQKLTFTEVKADAQILLDGLCKILNHIQEIANRSVNSFRTEDYSLHDYSKAGTFMLVNCGHGGHYTNLNRHQLEIHLINSNFI